MKSISKKDKKLFLAYLFLMTLFSLCLQQNLEELSKENLISFLSIIIGFLLTALSILYASPLRGVLYKVTDKDYVTLWQKVLAYYKFCTCYSITFIIFLLIHPKFNNLFLDLNFVHFSFNEENIKFILSTGAIYWIIKVLKNLFVLLSIEVV